MSLGVVIQRDLTSFMKSGAYAIGNSGEDIIVDSNSDGQTGQFTVTALFLNLTNQWQIPYRDAGSVRLGVVRFDPLLINNDPNPGGNIIFPNPGNIERTFALGAYIPRTNSQKMYRTSDDVGTATWDEVNYISDPQTVEGAADVFPMITRDGPSVASGITTGNPGYWDFSTNFVIGNRLFFEGWDQDGSGNTVGTMLVGCSKIHDGNSQTSGGTVYVNLATGFGTPVPEMPYHYVVGPARYEASVLFGATVQMYNMQWLPDEDSAAAAPKGRIYMSGHEVNSPNYYIIVWEFNPENVSGSPVRTHFKKIQQTRWTCVPTTNVNVLPSSTSDTMISNSVSDPQTKPLFNPITGRSTVISGVTGVLVGGYTAPYLHTSIELTAQAVLDAVQPPNPRQEVTTNRITTFGSEAVGDLGELISGLDVGWVLEAISTKNELMNVINVSIPADPYTAVHPPIDPDTVFPLEVREDTTVLTLGVDYTINGSGQVDFDAGFFLDISKQYAIDYGHPANVVGVPLTPFGNLLNAATQTDANGEATTRVQYPDDDTDAGFVDKLTVTST